MVIIFHLLCLIALCWTALGYQQDATQSEQEREADTYRIYSLLMRNPPMSYGADANARYLIAATTSLSFGQQQPCVRPPKEREIEYGEVLAEFEIRKTVPRTLKPRLSIRKPYEFLTDEQVKVFQNERDGPKADHRTSDSRLSRVTDLFTLSDVYFSKNGRLALTAVSSWCGLLCGKQQWKVFEKLPTGEWQEQPSWVTCLTVAEVLAPRHAVARTEVSNLQGPFPVR